MAIDYTIVIRDSVEPKLAYHGFRYDEQQSEPPAGLFRFTRQFFGKLQYVEFLRHRYLQDELPDLLTKGGDIPTGIPGEVVQIDEPGYKLWLSNRYILVAVHHENVGHFICHGPLEADDACLWEYHTEAELRRALKDMVELVLTEGLEWFEEQLAEIRRHHEKLDARRVVEKQRREGRDRKQV